MGRRAESIGSDSKIWVMLIDTVTKSDPSLKKGLSIRLSSLRAVPFDWSEPVATWINQSILVLKVSSDFRKFIGS